MVVRFFFSLKGRFFPFLQFKNDPRQFCKIWPPIIGGPQKHFLSIFPIGGGGKYWNQTNFNNRLLKGNWGAPPAGNVFKKF